jgi:membrane protein
MANDIHAEAAPSAAPASNEPSMTATLRGIVDDALELMKQQFAMLKAEVRSDFHKLLAGIIPLLIAIGPLLLGGLMLCFAVVHLIHWASVPSGVVGDPALIPLWVCYLIVSAAMLLIGGILLAVGVSRLRSVNPIPEETAKALEENLQWLMNKTPK